MHLPFPDFPDEAASPPAPGKDEMNFAEFPITLLTDRAPKNQKSIKFEDKVYDERRKRTITRRRIIEGSEEYGLPTATDDIVILALIQLTKDSNFTQRELEFTRLQLIEKLGWPNDGKSYDRIKLSLQRIANVTYTYDNAWWDPRQKSWTTKIFHILDTVEINDSRTSVQGALFSSRIVWNEVVFDSFQAGFLRNIDFDLCMRLEHPIALRMYRFLGKRFYIQPDLTFDLKDFAHNYMNLGRNYEGGTQIARKLKPAIEELETAGFLEPLAENERFIKKGWEWSIRFVQKQVEAQALPPAPTPTDVPPLVQALVTRGVTASAAADLAKRFPAERIQAKLELFDWWRAQPGKALKNPVGYLVKCITDDYQAPEGFIPKAERERQQEAQRQKAQKAADSRHRQQEEKKRSEERDRRVDAYWASLDAKQQAALQAKADALADPDSLAREANAPGCEALKRMGQRIRRYEYIERLLEGKATIAAQA